MKPSIEIIRLLAVILITFTHTRNDLESGIAFFIFEQLPVYGTAILSVVSGYLYHEVSRQKKGLFIRKVKSLLVPYILANLSVLTLVLVSYFFFDYNALNRLSYDASLVLEGLFSLNSPPINPPTYFLRDIFVLFMVLSLVTQKDYRTLFILVPLLLFGTFILRGDIAFLFAMGVLFSRYRQLVSKKYSLVVLAIATAVIVAFFPEYLKFPIAILLFVLVIDLDFRLLKVSRFSYLLHLYHSPIMVVSYPVLSLYISSTLFVVIAQIFITILLVYVLYLFTKKYPVLSVLSGGR